MRTENSRMCDRIGLACIFVGFGLMCLFIGLSNTDWRSCPEVTSSEQSYSQTP